MITEVHGVLVGKERSAQDFANSSDAVLEEIIKRNQEKIDLINERKYSTGAAGQAAGYLVEGLAVMHIGLDSAAAQSVLDQRRSLRGADYQTALGNFQGDPLRFDDLYRAAQETTTETARLADGVARISRQLDQGIRTVVSPTNV